MNTLVKSNNSLSNVFDELFDNVPIVWSKDNSFPAVNIHEDDKSYELDLVAPGLKKDDFKVSLEKGMLTISYKKEEKKEEEKKNRKDHRIEYSLSSFTRSFSLDDNIDAEKIEATYENGVLKLVLPKKEEVKVMPKQIAIK